MLRDRFGVGGCDGVGDYDDADGGKSDSDDDCSHLCL